jgi:hypothetical protein
MLSDLARERPSAPEVLAHPWLRRDPGGSGVRAARRLGRAVQRRMTALANSRQLLGTRRAMLVLHGGTAGAAEAFHRAVREAVRLKEEADRRAAAIAADSSSAPGMAAALGPASSLAAAAGAGSGAAALAGARGERRLEGGRCSAASMKRPAPRDGPLDSGALQPDQPVAASEEGEAAAGQAGAAQMAAVSKQQERSSHDASCSPPASVRPRSVAATAEPPLRKRRRGAQVSALAAAIACASEQPLADLAAGKDASLADLARVSLARRSLVLQGGSAARVGQGRPQQGGHEPAGRTSNSNVFVGVAVEAGVPAAAAGGGEGAGRGAAGTLWLDAHGGGPLLLPSALERGISMPADLTPQKPGANPSLGLGSGRRARLGLSGGAAEPETARGLLWPLPIYNGNGLIGPLP